MKYIIAQGGQLGGQATSEIEKVSYFLNMTEVYINLLFEVIDPPDKADEAASAATELTSSDLRITQLFTSRILLV